LSAKRFAMATLAMLCNAAHAQGYVCTTSEGHYVAGVTPPPECKDREIRVMNADGSVKNVIPATLTPEQRRESDAADQKRTQERFEQSLEHQRHSLDLPPVDEIEWTRRHDLAKQQLLIDRANQRIAECERERNRLVAEPVVYPHGMPDDVKEKFEANKLCVWQQEKARADAQLEMQHINAHYDAQKARYRELEEIARRSKPEELPRAAPELPLPATSR
jgi:hypothetical protein